MYDGDTTAYNLPYIRKVFVSHRYILLRLLTRKAGFYVARATHFILRALPIYKGDVRLVNRERARVFGRYLVMNYCAHGISQRQVAGYGQEKDHISVASAVASGAADVGLGIEKSKRVLSM